MKKIPYEDITDSILKQAIPNNNPIPEICKYKKYNLNNSRFDSKDITDVERKTLKIIQNKIGGQFIIIHRVQKNYFKTPDAEYYNKLLHKNKRYYDVKAPRKSDTDKSKESKIYHSFDSIKGQANCIIISLLREECNLSNNDAVKQIMTNMQKERYKFIKIVILVGKNDYFKIFNRK